MQALSRCDHGAAAGTDCKTPLLGIGNRIGALPVRPGWDVAWPDAAPSLRLEIEFRARALDDAIYLGRGHSARQVVHSCEALPKQLYAAGASGARSGHAQWPSVGYWLPWRASVRGRCAGCVKETADGVSLPPYPPCCVVTLRGGQTASPTVRCITQHNGGIQCQTWFPKIMPRR